MPEPSKDWPELSVVQQWFYAVVTHPDGIEAGAESEDALKLAPMSRGDLEKMVTRSGKVSARDRLAIYGNAYFARLIECLSELYPVLKQTMGQELFNGFAFDYLQNHPSRTYTLARLGNQFADYLRETRPESETTAPDWADFLIDLSELEWTIADVFDGPGIERETTLNETMLQNIPPDRWPDVRLRTSPCLRLIQWSFPVNDYYTDARKNPENKKFPRAEDAWVAINRRDYIVRRHKLSRTQFRLLTELQHGQPIGEAIESAARTSDLDDDALAAEIQQWFRDWSRFQFFLAAEIK